jgi:DNA primase
VSVPGESLFERYKNEVRTRLSLRDLVEACAPKGLRATGKSSILCCSPLRQDRHPSFSVFEGGGEYVAFDHATRESFDLYSFVEKKEGLDFVGAVKWCGDRVNLPWDTYRQQHGEGQGRSKPLAGFTQEEWDRAAEATLALDERQLVANVQQALVDLCHGWFLGLPKLHAMVTARWGISEETQRRFMLGFVPHGFAAILDDLRERGAFPYSRKQLAKTGWFLQRAQIPDDPDPLLQCLFDGRLLYPYLLRGKCRYACARIIFEDRIDPAYFETHPWDQSKFKKALVGGPSHPSVSKFVQNDLLYNADNAAHSRTNFARIVIPEGPSDCMTLVEAGYDSVAPVATSIRSEDVPKLLEAVSRYKEVVLATDTDIKPDGRRPGLEGALRMAPELLAAGKKVKLLVFPLPPGETKVDPASWALAWKRAGKEGDPFAELMANAPSVSAALVGFLDPDLTASQLPEKLEPIIRFARTAKSTKAEIDEIARLVQKQLKGNFSRTAIKQSMGEATEKLDAEMRAEQAAAAVQDSKTLDIEGRVIERGGFDQPGSVRCYQGFAKDDSPIIVSTFILQPSRIIINGAGERLLEVSVHIETDTLLVERWVVPKKAWTSRRDFVTAFPHERMQFCGSDFNVHSVYQIVSERAARLGVRTVRGESVVGLHKTAGGLRLVLPTETWGPDGVMADPDVVYASDNGSVPFCTMLRVDGEQDPASVDELIPRVLALLFALNDPIKLTVLCAWIVGCYFLPEIRELNGGKASILNVYGSPGAAKSTTLKEVLNKTLQPFGPNFAPATPAETRFATIRNLSWSNLFVSAFDEYRVGEAGSDFMRLIRTGFSGASEMRGSRDQSVRGYDLCGAVQIAGEQRADVDAAMAERLVMVALDKTTVESGAAASELHDLLAIEDRWRVATDILQWRMRLGPGTAHDWWAQAKASATEAIDRMRVRIAPRTRDLCVELAFRLRVWTEWLDHRAARTVTVPRPGLESVLRLVLETATGITIPEDGGAIIAVATKTLVVRALEEITAYAVSGQFDHGRGYRLAVRATRKMLVIHPGSLAAALAKESRARGRPDPTNGEAALKRAAKEEYDKEGDLGWLVDPSFPYRMGSTDEVGDEQGKSARLRCWLIDVEKAHERVGLELDWPGTAATWGGDRKTLQATLPPWRRLPADGGV